MLVWFARSANKCDTVDNSGMVTETPHVYRFVRTLLVGALLSGCLIFDTTDVPEFPQRRPVLISSEASPRNSAILREFPTELVVPVELIQVQSPFQYRVFYDYTSDPLASRAPEVAGTSIHEVGAAGKGVRVLQVPLPRPSELSGCVRIELVVAFGFEGDISGPAAHAPRAPGGDSLNWVYEAPGSVGCSVVANTPDAGTNDR